MEFYEILFLVLTGCMFPFVMGMIFGSTTKTDKKTSIWVFITMITFFITLSLLILCLNENIYFAMEMN